MRTMKMAWKPILAITFLAAVVALAVYRLHGGWAYHVIDKPWIRYRTVWVTLSDQPIQFALSVATYAAIAVLLSTIVLFSVSSLRRELRTFRARETRPPFDDAIRQPFDER